MWNYRVIKKVTKEEIIYGIYEVYYNDKEEIDSWTTNPTDLSNDTFDGLRDNYLMMAEVFINPILDEQELIKKITEKIIWSKC